MQYILLFLVSRTAQHEFTRTILLTGASSLPFGPCSYSTAIVRGDPRSALQFYMLFARRSLAASRCVREC